MFVDLKQTTSLGGDFSYSSKQIVLLCTNTDRMKRMELILILVLEFV